MKNIINKILPFIFGAVFGIANIIPGVSGGTMMVVCGCYDKVCGALALDFKHIKKHIIFLLTFFAGAVAGLFGFAFLASELIENHPVPTYIFLALLVLSSLPFIIKKLLSENKFKAYHVAFAIIALAAVISLGVLEGMTADTEAAEIISTGFNIKNAARLFFGGFLAAMAMIIPGLSGSFVFLLLGIWDTVIDAVTRLDLWILVPAGLGILAGIILGARGIRSMLSRYHTTAYSVITGLVLGSVFVIIYRLFI